MRRLLIGIPRRAPVQSDKVPETVAETVVPVIEEAGLQPESRQKKEDERACSASSSPASLCPLECQRKSSCGATHSHG
ncbi:uncharacterized protein LOC110637558 isoform X2 [Hevea brasiliensis]|uniref:uncharacterized protein LOC110637558 isoform X2 n=1 Tax=Hevea brasiliensis TaxID=3981 RepID=UPI0025EF18C1|nr:uncharacterized protein LOC110637558 isoform X2 [Hevea brasiliensis]